MKHTAHSTQHTETAFDRLLLLAVCCLLSAALAGCEGLQRKFTRKPKQPVTPPTPIVVFQDYTRAMTPLDRYRKHSLMFDYWSDELIRALQGGSFNAKRLTRASTEALAELTTMRGLLLPELAQRLDPLIAERTELHQQLRQPTFGAGAAHGIRQALETQTRRIHRDFFWRDVEDHLNAQAD